MGQLGFFDLNRRYESLDEKSDSLVAIAAMVPFESFRSKLKAALIKGELRRSVGERKPWDEVMIFKALVLQALYNLSDDQAEYQLRDRLSFMRFLGLELEDTVPDAKTLWLYREALGKAGAVEELFDLFDGFLKDKGYLPWAGRSSTRRSCQRPSNTIRARRTRRSRKAKRRKTGNPSPPRTARRTRTRAGRRSMNARISVTRTISASIAGTNSCAVTW